MPCCNIVIRKQRGFTLVELLVVLSLTSLLVNLTVMPVYRQWLQEVRLEFKARQLLLLLKFARTIAIQRYQKVVVCHSRDGKACNGTAQDDWIVLSSPDHSVPKVVTVIKGLDAKQSVAFYGARHVDSVIFQPLGTSAGYNGRFVLCAKDSKIAFYIFVSPTGRARLESTHDLSCCQPLGA